MGGRREAEHLEKIANTETEEEKKKSLLCQVSCKKNECFVMLGLSSLLHTKMIKLGWVDVLH